MRTKDEKPLTKSVFHALLRKAAQPIPKEVESPVLVESETSAVRPSGDCTETHKNPDTLEDIED